MPDRRARRTVPFFPGDFVTPPEYVIFVWPYALEGLALNGETFSTFALNNRSTICEPSEADLVADDAWRAPCGKWNVYPKPKGWGRLERSPMAPVRYANAD